MTARSRKRQAVVLFVVACVAGGSVALGYPRPVSHPILGDGWQCSRMAFLTRCTRTDPKAPAVDGMPIAPIAFRPV